MGLRESPHGVRFAPLQRPYQAVWSIGGAGGGSVFWHAGCKRVGRVDAATFGLGANETPDILSPLSGPNAGDRWLRADLFWGRNMQDRLARGCRVSILGLSVNGALAVVKLVCGIAGNSYALVADAIESLGDIFSSLIVWSGLVIASRPADADHPYGHGKAEPLAAFCVALLLIGAAATIAVQAVHEIRTPHEVPAAYTLFVLLVVVAVKEGMYRYARRTGENIGSTAVIVDAWHHRSDAMTSAAAAVGISIALLGGAAYAPADDWAALFACTVITFNALGFIRTAIGELMDRRPNLALIEAIPLAALQTDGAQRVEKVLVRKMGPFLYVDLHLEVDPMLTVLDAHRIAHQVKDAIRNRWPQIADVLVHTEPAGGVPGAYPAPSATS